LEEDIITAQLTLLEIRMSSKISITKTNLMVNGTLSSLATSALEIQEKLDPMFSLMKKIQQNLQQMFFMNSLGITSTSR
jgi:hypothetical protein